MKETQIDRGIKLHEKREREEDETCCILIKGLNVAQR